MEHPARKITKIAREAERLVAGGAPSLHFYTLNLAKPTQTVLSRLGWAA